MSVGSCKTKQILCVVTCFLVFTFPSVLCILFLCKWSQFMLHQVYKQVMTLKITFLPLLSLFQEGEYPVL